MPDKMKNDGLQMINTKNDKHNINNKKLNYRMPSSIAKYNKNLNERRNGFMKIKNRLNYDNI